MWSKLKELLSIFSVLFAVIVWFSILLLLFHFNILTPDIWPDIGSVLMLIGGFATVNQIYEWNRKFSSNLRSAEIDRFTKICPDTMAEFSNWRRQNRSRWQKFTYWLFFIGDF